MSVDSYDVVPTERISLIVVSVSINGCYRRVLWRRTVFWRKQYKQRINGHPKYGMEFLNKMCA